MIPQLKEDLSGELKTMTFIGSVDVVYTLSYDLHTHFPALEKKSKARLSVHLWRGKTGNFSKT